MFHIAQLEKVNEALLNMTFLRLAGFSTN
jgi:hypothetical protein